MPQSLAMGKALKIQNLRGFRRDPSQLLKSHRQLETEAVLLPNFWLSDRKVKALRAGNTAAKKRSQRGPGHSGNLRKGAAPEKQFHANGSRLA